MCLVCFLKANSQEDYPILNSIATDNANLFSTEELVQLTEKLTEYEARTTHQIVVLTINNLGNDTVENYALQTFNLEGNQFGQEQADNGILILVAKNDRKFRIEVGDGLTPIITDLLASRINRNIITPAFKEGDFYEGIDIATTELIKLIDNPDYAEEFSNLYNDNDESVSLTVKFFSAIFLTICFFLLGFFGYNYVAKKRKIKKIDFKKLYSNKTRFFTIWGLAICIVIYFNNYFWYAFLAIFCIGFFSVFIGVGWFVIFPAFFKRSVSIFTALFTGKLGVFIFPFYLPMALLLFIASLMFGCFPLIMGILFISEVLFNTSINEIIIGIPAFYFLYFFIGFIVLLFIITAAVAYNNVRSSLKKTFGFSFFKIDETFIKNVRSSSSRGYSSSGSSSYSSSSSRSSSFSGGGGSSSGGGSSGSW